MSIELKLVMVPDNLVETYEADSMIETLWDTQHLHEQLIGMEKQEAKKIASDLVKEDLGQYFPEEEVSLHSANILKLIDADGLTTDCFELGSGWQSFDQWFKRAENEKKIEILQSTFYGRRPTKHRISTSYGEAGVLRAVEVKEVAEALKGVTLETLQKWAKQSLNDEHVSWNTTDHIPDDYDFEVLDVLVAFYEGASSKNLAVLAGIE